MKVHDLVHPLFLRQFISYDLCGPHNNVNNITGMITDIRLTSGAQVQGWSYLGRTSNQFKLSNIWQLFDVAGGGFHHCSSKEGGGFCAYADITLSVKVHIYVCTYVISGPDTWETEEKKVSSFQRMICALYLFQR